VFYVWVRIVVLVRPHAPMQQHHATHAQHAQEGIAHGVHIMAIGKETVVPDILQAANL